VAKTSDDPTSDARLAAILDAAFDAHAGPSAVIGLADLQRALGLRSEYLAKRIFKQFDADGDGAIRRDEFAAGARLLLQGSDRDKLQFAFRLHDDDGDGTLSRDELVRLIAISLAESDIVERPTQPAEHLAAAFFRRVDKDKDGTISFDEFAAALGERPDLLRKMTRNEAAWLAPNEGLVQWIDAQVAHGASTGGIGSVLGEERSKPKLFLAYWAFLNVAIAAVSLRAIASTGQDVRMQLGRALGGLLSFNGGLVLVPVLRRTLTAVRATWLGRVLPLDDAIELHKLVGHVLFALSWLHAIAFTLAFAGGHRAASIFEYLAHGRAFTGVLLLCVFSTMWICALPFVRRTRRFELFYFTHLLYVVWLAVALVHAPTFVAWVGAPLVLFVGELIWRLLRRRSASSVIAAEPLRSGVTRLEIAKPEGFTHSPSDYVFVRIPQIAKHEWHPFTISSAPETSTLGLHVRSLGNWTSTLRRRAEEGAPLTAYLDGPYGSPSAHIFESRFAVLIGAGIGVTPFASVLESIVMRINGASSAPSKLERVHFFWLNRDPYSFEWFGALLHDLEALDRKGALFIHLCVTGARAGASSLGLELARSLMMREGRSDVVTGLRTHTHFGVPDWEAMLGGIAREHPNERVDVYFCGPPGLAGKLGPLCARLGMRFREERF
jgi:predicted ferric reductase/Ca2+-binding EF-hand superfamily protein